MTKKPMPKLVKVYLPATCALVVLILAVLELSGATHLFLNKTSDQPITASQYTKGEPGDSQNSSSSTSAEKSSDTTQPGDNKSMNGGSSGTDLVAPTGDFVSNHHPNLDSDPAPNTIASVCVTSPGATCSIRFTNQGVTKTLSGQITDRGGATYWNWKLQDIGLTVGTWQVEAIATLDGKTQKSNDALALEVGQ